MPATLVLYIRRSKDVAGAKIMTVVRPMEDLDAAAIVHGGSVCSYDLQGVIRQKVAAYFAPDPALGILRREGRRASRCRSWER